MYKGKKDGGLLKRKAEGSKIRRTTIVKEIKKGYCFNVRVIPYKKG